MESEFINMNRTENYNSAHERLKEAQHLLLLAIEHGSISALDRDLLLEKLRKAYDFILFENEKSIVISPIVDQPAKVKVEKVSEIPLKPLAPEIKPQIKQESKPIQQRAKPVESNPVVEKVSIFDSSIKGLSKVDEKVDEPIEGKQKEQSILKTPQPASLSEKLQGKQKTMTDSLSNQIKEKPVASQLQNKPISDLTKEIGVHDKFLFRK